MASYREVPYRASFGYGATPLVPERYGTRYLLPICSIVRYESYLKMSAIAPGI